MHRPLVVLGIAGFIGWHVRERERAEAAAVVDAFRTRGAEAEALQAQFELRSLANQDAFFAAMLALAVGGFLWASAKG